MELTVPITVEFDEERMRKVIEKYIQEHDVVEVIRCKDCKHNHNGFCFQLSRIDEFQNSYFLVVNDNDFCKWGEKE